MAIGMMKTVYSFVRALSVEIFRRILLQRTRWIHSRQIHKIRDIAFVQYELRVLGTCFSLNYKLKTFLSGSTWSVVVSYFCYVVKLELAWTAMIVKTFPVVIISFITGDPCNVVQKGLQWNKVRFGNFVLITAEFRIDELSVLSHPVWFATKDST